MNKCKTCKRFAEVVNELLCDFELASRFYDARDLEDTGLIDEWDVTL